MFFFSLAAGGAHCLYLVHHPPHGCMGRGPKNFFSPDSHNFCQNVCFRFVLPSMHRLDHCMCSCDPPAPCTSLQVYKTSIITSGGGVPIHHRLCLHPPLPRGCAEVLPRGASQGDWCVYKLYRNSDGCMGYSAKQLLAAWTPKLCAMVTPCHFCKFHWLSFRRDGPFGERISQWESWELPSSGNVQCEVLDQQNIFHRSSYKYDEQKYN